jgi:CPA2 family monovalent cation:H+ antiporter-2
LWAGAGGEAARRPAAARDGAPAQGYNGAMPGAHAFLVALAVVLGVAAVTTVAFQRLKQPVVLGYVLAGIIVGPHVPIPLVADVGIVQILSELGVILLMFALGLEFSLRKLVRVGPVAGVTALVQCTVMFWLGLVTGRALGWTMLESIFAGAIVAISSTTIIAKAFDELGIKGRLRELVVGVLVVEDLIAILLMAVLTGLARGRGVAPGELLLTLGRLVLFLAVLLGVGMLLIPRAVRWIRRLDRPETMLVAVLGICFGIALLAQEAGYSVALGAFLAGSLVAESGEERYVEHLVQPVRDVFAAIFFVSVGMLIDPAILARHWAAILLFTAVVIAGKLTSVAFGAFLTGQGTRTSVQAGMSLAQIGEFSFIIAALGLSLGATGDFLYPVTVSVSAITTLTTPWLIRSSDRAASWVDRKLPRPVQTVAALYGSWLERLRLSPDLGATASQVRKVVRALLLDAVLLAAVVVGTALSRPRLVEVLETRFALGAAVATWATLAVAGVVSVPFGAGILRNARRLGVVLASGALPAAGQGGPDLAAAPRRALVTTLQLGVVVLTIVPILVVTQPFLPWMPVLGLVGVILVVLGVAFWRGATNLQGHVRAGAQVIVEVLASHARGPARQEADVLAQLRQVLPGLGEPVALRLEGGSAAVGRSLAALDLRGVTGATVLAIWRPDGGVMVPSAQEVLRVGDVLAVAGTAEALAGARRVLEPPPPGAAPAAGAPTAA